MTTSALLNPYDFLGEYTLQKLQEVLPCCEVKITQIMLPDVSDPVPIDALCDRYIVLTKDYRKWTWEQQRVAFLVGEKLHELYEAGYWQWVQSRPICLAWMCSWPYSWLCCDWPSEAVMVTRTRVDNLFQRLFESSV